MFVKLPIQASAAAGFTGAEKEIVALAAKTERSGTERGTEIKKQEEEKQ